MTTASGNQLTRQEQALLVEYQVCQSYVNSLGSQFWTITSIVISANVATLGWVARGIVSDSINTFAKLPVLGLGIAMIVILVSFRLFLKRLQFLTSVNNERMREIEDTVLIDNKMVIWKNWIVCGLDLMKQNKWCILSDEKKKKIIDYSKKVDYKPPRSSVVNFLFVTTMLLWIALAVALFII